MPTSSIMFRLYLDLRQKYGDPQKLWPQWCAKRKTLKLRELIIIGAILTQRTTWHNANLALKKLRARNLLSLSKIAGLKNLAKLTALIRPSGFFQSKPKRLFTLSSYVTGKYGGLTNLMKQDWEIIRSELLAILGIGPETADTICLYALDKPTFVVDEYTKRWVTTHKLSQDLKYDHLKALFEESLPKAVELYQDFHALIIIDQKGKEKSKMEKV